MTCGGKETIYVRKNETVTQRHFQSKIERNKFNVNVE
jgi:hypothetical protein